VGHEFCRRRAGSRAGIVKEDAAALARAAGLAVVMDRCTLRENRRLLARPAQAK
jgi:predicted CoA-binding protein